MVNITAILTGAGAEGDDLAQCRVPVVPFTGGEPLCRPDLVDLVAHATARGLRCAISTNGHAAGR